MRVKARAPDPVLDAGRLVHVGSKAAAGEPQQGAHQRDPDAGCCAVTRIGERQHPLRPVQGRRQQSLGIGVAADHLVQDDNIRRFNLVGQVDEIPLPVIGALGEPGALRLTARFLEQTRGEIDADARRAPACNSAR